MQPEAGTLDANELDKALSAAQGGDVAAFVGEAKGLWLWALVWPASAGVLMYDSLTLLDLRDGYQEALASPQDADASSKAAPTARTRAPHCKHEAKRAQRSDKTRHQSVACSSGPTRSAHSAGLHNDKINLSLRVI